MARAGRFARSLSPFGGGTLDPSRAFAVGDLPAPPTPVTPAPAPKPPTAPSSTTRPPSSGTTATRAPATKAVAAKPLATRARARVAPPPPPAKPTRKVGGPVGSGLKGGSGPRRPVARRPAPKPPKVGGSNINRQTSRIQS